jgi:ribosomal protein S18 acetylase RimI-like enzyme
MLATPSMPAVTIRNAGRREDGPVVSTLVMAFSTDPASRWVFPQPQDYLTHFPDFVKAFGGRAFLHQTAHVVEGYAGAALWLPPDVHPDEEELMALLQRTIPSEIREEAFAVFDQMGDYHPDEPHWYLPLIGVETQYQGRGYGSALLQHALTACDRDQTPAYLESSNVKNIPLYQRHGFEVLGTIQVGSSPQIFPMLRTPRRRPTGE